MARAQSAICGLVATLLLMACAPTNTPVAPGAGSNGGGGQSAAPATQRSGPKSLVWILNREPEGFSELFGGSASTHWGQMYHATHDFLVALDNNGEPVERLALERPSRAAGTWRINADGTMETA